MSKEKAIEIGREGTIIVNETKKQIIQRIALYSILESAEDDRAEEHEERFFEFLDATWGGDIRFAKQLDKIGYYEEVTVKMVKECFGRNYKQMFPMIDAL